MKNKQIIAILTPFVLIPSMYVIDHGLARIYGETIGWYLGFFPYWLVWCGLFPVWLIGRDNLRKIIQPQRLEGKILLLLSIPIIGASAYKFIPGMNYSEESLWLSIMVISTALGNGFFEEVLWRGVYMSLFPQKLFFRIFWPSVWFTLWHYAPGSVSSDGNVVALMIGSGIFGFYLSFLAKKTNTIWWCIVAHTVGGLIMVL